VIKDILTEIDRVDARARVECGQPISTRTAYNAGLRIGVVQGIDRVRQAIINMHAKDNAKEKDL
jgi:hypothetical protein